MKLFNLLKNKAGKLVMGTTQLTVLTVGAAGLFSSAMYQVGAKQGEPLAARSISSVSNTYSYEGLNRRSDGMLSSMNIQNRMGGKGVAVGAERERLEGNTSNNDFGLTAADNLENRFSVPGIGTAARISASDGLGTGGVDMTEIPSGVGAAPSVPSVKGVPSAAAPQGGAGSPAPASASGGSSSGGGRLATASMARASGSSFSGSGGAGGGSSGGGASGRRNAPSSPSSGSEGYNFSGAMPSGSNVVSSYQASLGGRGNGSTFLAGGRNATVGSGGRSVNETDDLKRISKMSADVAKDKNRGAAAGALPFLANTATTSGMSMEGGEETTTTGSADFETPTNNNLKAIGDWGNKQDEIDQKRAKDREQLIKLLISAFFATIAAMPLGYALIRSGMDSTSIFAKIFMVTMGCAVIAAAMAVAVWAIVAAGKFASNWGGGFLSTLTGIMGGICTSALALTIVAAFARKGSGLEKFYRKFMPKAAKLAIGQALAKGGEAVTNKIAEEAQEDAQKDNNK